MSNQKRKTTEHTMRHIMDDGTRVAPLSPLAAALAVVAILVAVALS